MVHCHMKETIAFIFSTIHFTHVSFPQSSNSKSKQWVAQCGMVWWGFMIGSRSKVVFITSTNTKCCTTLKGMFISLKKNLPLLVKLLFFGWVQTLQGENKIKGTRGTKVKFRFQGLHMIHVIFVLVYNIKVCILDTQFNTTC